MQPPKEQKIKGVDAGKRQNQESMRIKRGLYRVVVKDFLILMGLMSLLIMIRYQWDFISPLKFRDEKTQKSVERLEGQEWEMG